MAGRAEDRNKDLGPVGRKNWLIRNMGLTVFLIGLVCSGVGIWFNVKYATAQNTKDLSSILPKVENHGKIIATIPYIEKRVDAIADDVREFKREQRVFNERQTTHNAGINSKVDKVLEAVLRSNR